AINDGRILDVLPTAQAHANLRARQSITLPQHVLMPGLVNLHTHAAMSLLRGYGDDRPLMDWLHQRIWPAETQHVSADFAFDGTLLACAEMLRGGVTCFSDMYFFPDAAARAAREAGLRAVLGMIVIESASPYAHDAADYLRRGLAFR